jgi:hypothetical protein
MHTWAEPDQPVRLVEQTVAKDDPDPKALACYGLLRPDRKQVWLRFVDGRPISSVTTQFLAWCCARLEREGKAALLLVWDNASLPIKSPWLNNSEPCWVHAKRAIAEPDRLLAAQEVVQRVCDHFDSAHEPYLAIPEKVA